MATKILITMALAALALQASPGPRGKAGPDSIDVTGEVKLIAKNASRAVGDASDVVLWLVPMEAAREIPGSGLQRQHYRMLQHNKTFEPKLLVVPLGSVVDFPNLDPWFHNVFSLYQGKRFDLGLYQAGAERQVVFDRPGPSFLFCNIHPQMTAVIVAVNSDFFGISDKAGRILIRKVPAGRYAVHVWYENAASEFGDAPARATDIGPGENVLPAISIPVTKRDSSHKDKYGHDYDPQATAPAY